MARPLRFRHAPRQWTLDRVRTGLLDPLDANLGATMSRTWFKPPDGYHARRFDMDNGDVALFCWTDDATPGSSRTGAPSPGRGGYWVGNTETPETLWRTDKYGFDEIPASLADWAERELLAQLHQEAPWLEAYPSLSWFFLPVLLSKDGRHTTREFLRDRAAGFPDADPEEALDYFEDFFATGVLDEYREVMAGKLGTSEYLDHTRMSAAMGEFNAAKLLTDAGYGVIPEIEVDTGHSLDYRVVGRGKPGDGTLVEVTRPQPADDRRAASPETAVRETAGTKADGQLAEHEDVTLLVDCSSFPDMDWQAVRDERPEVPHQPAIIFRARPSGHIEGFEKGNVPLDLSTALEWVSSPA